MLKPPINVMWNLFYFAEGKAAWVFMLVLGCLHAGLHLWMVKLTVSDDNVRVS